MVAVRKISTALKRRICPAANIAFGGKHQAAFPCRLNKATKYAFLGNCEDGKADVYVDLLGVKGRKPLSFLSPFSFREKKSGGGPAAA